MKYKVGDKVRIKTSLVPDERYGSSTFVSQMLEFIGKEATVNMAHHNGLLSLEIDSKKVPWRWTDEMLEPVSEYPKEMWVWDKNTVDPIVREVVAYAPGIEFPYLTKDKNESNWRYIGYKYAKDLPQPKELTMQEIADKFGINVEQLKIKK